MKGVRKMINSLERMMKDTIKTARHFYEKGLFDSLPKTTVLRKLFNIHSRLHYEVSYLSRHYTRLIPNYRLLRFNSPCKCFKGSTRWWIKQHSSHAIPKQNNKWWNEIHTFFREEKNVSFYHYEIAFTMKAKENETFWLNGRKLLPLFRKAWRWNFYRKFRNMSSNFFK